MFVQAGPERSAQRNLGARLASGDYVVFIDSDMTVEPGVAEDVVQVFKAEDVGALVLPERLTGVDFWGRCRELEKRLYVGDDVVEAARAFPRSQFLALGGYDETLTGPEDWELPDRLRALGDRIGRTRAGVEHHEPALSLYGTFAKKRYYGRSLETFAHRERGRSLRRVLRPRFFLQLALAFPTQPLTALGVVVLKLAEYVGALVGAIDARYQSRGS